MLGWCLAITFCLIATVQRIELQHDHLKVAWGNAPEWLAGIGTVAAFGALLVAALEWRAGQAERRDNEADQARLIVAESVVDRVGDSMPWLRDCGVKVHNRSSAPVYDLLVCQVDQNRMLVSMSADGQSTYNTELQPGQATNYVRVYKGTSYDYCAPTNYVRFAFTDARGRRWARDGNSQPERIAST